MSIVKQTYRVENMMCAMCVAHVQKALEKCDGIKSVSVNLANSSALIEYDDNIANIQVLKQAVDNAGYKLIVEDTTPSIQEEVEKKN